MELTYWTLSDRLLEVVPELRDAYTNELGFWSPDKPGPHIVFGDLLTPYLISLLETNLNSDALFRAFTLLEELVAHPAPPVQEVAMASVLERVASNKNWSERAMSYMGPATRQAFQRIRGS